MSPRPGSLADRLSSSTAVLVVEDEPDIAALLGAFFRASGLGLIHINPRSVDEVMAAIDEHQPACVLLDVMLGGLSGLDVLAAIREDPQRRDLAVLVVSADARPGTRKEAEALGVTDFVAKPFSVSALFDQVSALAQSEAAPAEVPERGDRLASYVDGASRESPVSFALVRAGANEPALVSRLRTCLPEGSVVGESRDGEIPVTVPGTDAATIAGVLQTCVAAGGSGAAAGVAEAPLHASTADELYMAADAALAEAVERGLPVVAAR